MEKNIDEIKYPRFIQSKPLGQDKLAGASQQNLSNTIAEHILENDNAQNDDCLPRIIGIEGSWGCGKSNVVKLLEKDNRLKKYYFFEYDAWAYQEDLQRRSFLEKLTDELVENSILFGKIKIFDKNNKENTITWKEKLQQLLSRKIETTKNIHPKLGIGISLAGFNAMTLPLSIFIAEIFKNSFSETGQLFIALIPILLSILYFLIKLISDFESIKNFFSLYREKIDIEVTHEMISEQEPSVREFKQWMYEISASIKKNSQTDKLIIVYDNMDRLPAEKVKELWSSIHTFFAESEFENIWTIIPYDEKHLTCAFGKCEDDEAKRLTHYFVEKTFPVVYRVPEPIVTDYKEILNFFFIEAFGKTTDEMDLVNRAYRLVKKDANIRNIIGFINEMVSLKKQWKNEISFTSIGIFVLCKQKILLNIEEEILIGNYLLKNSLDTFIKKDDELLQKEIAALAYGVNTELAEQLLLKKSIKNYFTASEFYDIQALSKHSKFETIFDDVIYEIDDNFIDNIINNLDDLELSSSFKLKSWKYIINKKLQPELREKDFSNIFEKLLLHANQQQLQDLVDFFCEDAKESISKKEFSSSNYFNKLNTLEKFINEHKLLCNMMHNFDDEILEIEVIPFIEYVRTAKENYKQYALVAAPNPLLYHYESNLPNLFPDADIIEYLDKEMYNFDSLLNKIEDVIINNRVTEQNFKGIMEAYKSLSKEKPLQKKINSAILQQIYNTNQKVDEREINASYYDILALCLINNIGINDLSEQEIQKIAYVILWHSTLDELLTFVSQRNDQRLSQVVRRLLTEYDEGNIDLTIHLPNFEILKSKLALSNEDFFNVLNKFGQKSLEKITLDNIKQLLPQSTIFEHTVLFDNELAQHINNIIVELIKKTDTSVFYAQKDSQSSNYLFQVINILIKSKYMEKVPKNLIEFGKKVLKDISIGSQAVPLPQITNKILDQIINADKISSVREIVNNICNTTISITIEMFLYFEEIFRTGELLDSRAGECVSKIIKPIFNDEKCRKIILANQKYYIDVINKGKDESSELKQVIKTELQTNTDESFIVFAKQLNITVDEGEQK